MHREMKAETPEWKKEVAEKVRAYGERKKRLTTPPNPIKENQTSDSEVKRELTPIPVFTKQVEPAIEFEMEEEALPVLEPEPKNHPAIESVENHPLDVWTEDLHGIEEDQQEDLLFTKETTVSPGPYTLR